MPTWITTDGGQTWSQQVMPQAIDAPAKASPENGSVCCDPTFAADDLGNIWFGGLTLPNGSTNPSRIVVNRIAAGGTTFRAQTVGLPTGAAGTQDKPMMTIDTTPTSPTYGRLYVVWDEPASGGVRVVVSTCDTRPGGVPNAANCDDADHWTAPARITPTGGSYIYADVAVGPTGTAYVTWWDYSNTNGIRGATCDGASVSCATAANWSAAQTIAQLDTTGGTPVPFACPIVAQPGGRAAPDPQVAVDHSGGVNNGRVYATWGDLRAGSGTTRCAEQANGNGTPPLASHLTWDSFAAIGSAAGALPGGAQASANVGTKLLTDGEGGGQSNSDDWFPWLAVDQSTGQAWADFYSTREDGTRTTANFYARSVTASGSTLTVGALNKLSTAASNYSGHPCCMFGNDYGDYTGLDAAGGTALPVWSDNSTGDGEAFTFISTLGAAPPGPTGGGSGTTTGSPPASGGSGTTTGSPPASGGTAIPPATSTHAFALSLTFPSQRLGTVLARRGVRASAVCAAVCRLGARLSASAATARTLGLTRGRSAVELGRVTIARAAARRTSLSIPLSRRALRALAGRSAVAIELRITATPLDGRRGVTRAVRLTLRRRGSSPSVTALRG